MLPLGRLADHPLFAVRLQAEAGLPPHAHAAATLHLLVDQHVVPALAGGKQRRAESEAVEFAARCPDLATDFQMPARSPDLLHIQWYTAEHPAQIPGHVLECGG